MNLITILSVVWPLPIVFNTNICCLYFIVYSPVHKNAGFIRSKSRDTQHKAPTLPKQGAQQYAKTIREEEITKADFMKTPAAGMAGWEQTKFPYLCPHSVYYSDMIKYLWTRFILLSSTVHFSWVW